MDLNSKDQLDFFDDFKKIYHQILTDFNFDFNEDRRARDLLSEMINKKKNWNLLEVLSSFNELIKSKNIILIYGCGPSLKETVEKLTDNLGIEFFREVLNLAADGASILLKEKSIPIDAIFTDLDGITEEMFNFTKFVIFHAHGDNIERMDNFMERIVNFRNFIGTVQVEPSDNTINSGGFTDGDRILYFIRKLLLPQHKLFLIGMDFDDLIGKYSKPSYTEDRKAGIIKKKKLEYAVKLILSFENSVQNDLFLVNSRFKQNIFKNLSINEFFNEIIKS